VEKIVSHPWFMLIVAVIGIAGALASLWTLRKRKASQSISVGGNAKGKFEQKASATDQPSQQIDVQGEINGAVRQTQE